MCCFLLLLVFCFCFFVCFLLVLCLFVWVFLFLSDTLYSGPSTVMLSPSPLLSYEITNAVHETKERSPPPPPLSPAPANSINQSIRNHLLYPPIPTPQTLSSNQSLITCATPSPLLSQFDVFNEDKTMTLVAQPTRYLWYKDVRETSSHGVNSRIVHGVIQISPFVARARG